VTATPDGSFEEAFEALFARAYRVALRILGHSGEAEDVAAEALARALRSWRRVALRSPEAWVVRVTTNLAIDVVRRRKWMGDSAGVADARVDGAARGDDADTRLALREMLHSLPRRQRDVLALRYLADLSEADTAAVLGIAPGTVKRHANRGVERMRRRLGDNGDSKEVVSVAW
jgi:RNA polymerase sigma factor (sigma-70 family)